MPFLVLVLALVGCILCDYAVVFAARTSDGSPGQVSIRVMSSGGILLGVSVAALMFGGPWVASLAVGAGIAAALATWAGAWIRWGRPDHANILLAVIYAE